ncbi:hypothetical protein [Jeotgalibacillus soli]|uniref:Competence protein n=1 Tax=Jeotgalibacillus soli TaxID=889306 RepID=A0A0C2RVL5_9BACL|nr:hypothetical protein [Jeotgalibacillus soli]KIL45809.1 hypothetical protein KP78_21580 [Jeotgalibacillus soli]
MGKRNKSKRFTQQSKDSVSRHDSKIPYHMTLAEAEALKLRSNSGVIEDTTLGGF